MSQNQAAGVLALAVALIAAVFILTFFGARKIVQLLLNSALGVMVMLLLNTVGAGLVINWVSIACCGVFGLPGAGLVLLLQKLFL